MNLYEKELKNLLNRERVEKVNIYKYGIYITTEDQEVEITANDDELHLEIKDREFIE